MNASHDGHFVHSTAACVAGGVATSDDMSDDQCFCVETAVLGAGARQRLLDVLARRRLAAGLAEDARDDQREDVGGAAVAVDAGRVDGEVERAPPATPAAAPPRSCRGRRRPRARGRRRPRAAARTRRPRRSGRARGESSRRRARRRRRPERHSRPVSPPRGPPPADRRSGTRSRDPAVRPGSRDRPRGRA